MQDSRPQTRRPLPRLAIPLTLVGWGAIVLSALLLALITTATVKGYY